MSRLTYCRRSPILALLSTQAFRRKDDLIAFVTTQSGKVGTREIGRPPSGLKPQDRNHLKQLLNSASEDRIERRRNNAALRPRAPCPRW